jgi:hypothetical protein
MKSVCLSLLLALLAGCIIAPPEDPESPGLRLRPLTDITLAERQQHTTVLEVTGAAEGSEVVFSAEGLPRFAVLEGARLRLSPLPGDAGAYVVLLRATDGTAEASETLHLTIAPGVNTAPDFVTPSWFDEDGTFLQFSGAIRVKGTPYVRTWVSDAENDAALLLVELRPVDQPFTGTATHQTQGDVRPGDSQGLRLNLTGLTPGVHYHVQFWLRDSGGMESTRYVLATDLMREL